MDNLLFFQNAFPYLTRNHFELNNLYTSNTTFIYTHPCGIPICLNWNLIQKRYSDPDLFFTKFMQSIPNLENNEIDKINIYDHELTSDQLNDLSNVFKYVLEDNDMLEFQSYVTNYCPSIHYLDWKTFNKCKRHPYIFELINQFGYYRQDTLTVNFYIKRPTDIDYFNQYTIDLNKVSNAIKVIKQLCECGWIYKEHIILFINSYDIYNREITYADKLKWY